MSSWLEQRVAALQKRVDELEKIIVTGRIPPPSDDEYRMAIDAMLDGDTGPLDRYLQRNGGRVPKPDAVFPPVMPPGAVKGQRQ